MHTGVSELAILLAAVFWTVIWGPVGLLVSIPLTVCIVVLGRYFPFLSTVHVLLSEEPSLSMEARVYQRLLRRDFDSAREQVLEFAQNHSAVETFDSAMIPTLSLAASDRDRGLLDRNRFDFVLSSLREIGLEIPCDEGSEDGVVRWRGRAGDSKSTCTLRSRLQPGGWSSAHSCLRACCDRSASTLLIFHRQSPEECRNSVTPRPIFFVFRHSPHSHLPMRGT